MTDINDVFYGCSTATQSSSARPRRSRGDRSPTIDLHCHFLNDQVERLVAHLPQKKAELDVQMANAGQVSAIRNAELMRTTYRPKLIDIDVRLADMDAMGVDIQAVSPAPNQYYYWAEIDLAVEIVRTTNERIAEVCAAHPNRFVGLGTVALQDPKLAVEQADYAVRKLGLRGIEISSLVNGVGVADPKFDPFWAKMEALGAVVFLHPLGTSIGPRLNSHYLSNIVGQPAETTITLSQMIFGGVFDRFENLKLCAAHGGGYLPLYIGRSDRGFAVRPESCHCRRRPSEYLKRIWYDTVVHDADQLRHLINVVGASRIVIGTDYPFDMGHYAPQELLDRVAGLSEAEREMILGRNAAELLNLTALYVSDEISARGHDEA